MEEKEEEVLYCVKDGNAVITLNRPKVGNSLNSGMTKKLLEILKKAEEDKQVHCITITGSGKYFCSGMDLRGALGEEKGGKGGADFLFSTIYDSKKPTIARINGPALGGGVGLVFACDIRIISEDSYIQFPEVYRGILPALISGNFLKSYCNPHLI